MDFGFGDLDGPSKAPATKTTRFAPKNSKLKPKREPEAPVPSSVSNPVTVPKVELEDLKPPPPTPPPIATVDSKAEIEKPSHTVPPSHDDNGDMTMDTDATEMEIDNDQQDEEDHVVREIDVYFNSSADANSKLYVLQYPLRQRWRPYELDDRCEKVRLKPGTAEVEVEMSVQVNSENFDPDVTDKAMKKQILSTSWKPPIANGYAVGILMGNELHLNTVNAVVQLRPSMQHLKPLKKMNTAHADTNMIDSEDIKDEKTIKQPKKQSKVPGVPIEQNGGIKEEEWIPLKYHGEASQLSNKCLQNMVKSQDSQTQDAQIKFSMNQSDYIDSLCPATSVRPKRPSVSSLVQIPLEERYKKRLLEGAPVRFNVFKHIAPDCSEEEMLKVLQTHAQLVQGLWVAKSKVKYNKDAGKEVLLRNYVMLEFSKSHIFRESQLPKQSSISEMMKTILDEFGARRDSFRDWKFREARDDLFIKEYPHIVEEQKKIWDRVEPQIIEVLFPKSSKHGIGDKRPILNNNNKNNIETKPPIVQPSKGVMLDETREALPKALQKLFQAYKVCSLNQIRQRLRDMAVSENTLRKGTREARAAAAAADAPQEELLKTLTQLAVNINGVFVSKSSPDHPQYDDFRSIVINLLIAEGPKGRLKRSSIEAAAEMQLKRTPSDTEFKKVLTEICVTQNSGWVLKSGDGSPT
ncbi:unnamed protein product [Lactuca saligna]|uniref:DNA-directed RNA polymerase III subunit RPC5 n=1 Tax=Lactuca saligna TaxID=75948 RepID=A0AA36E403_LACSI|nr:unnamed protein product [Lactuca saligna]